MTLAILAKCPHCYRRQSIKNNTCKCGTNLAKLKRQQKLEYYIALRIPGSKSLTKEYIGTSLKEAKDADAKRKVQKAENRIMDMLPESNITFAELTKWYIKLHKVKKLTMFDVLNIHLAMWNTEYGDFSANAIKPMHVEDFQTKMLDFGLSKSYIDQIVGSVRTILVKASDNDEISADCIKPFKRARKLLKKRNSNARDRILTQEEYYSLIEHLPKHLKPIVAMGYWAGMRRGEILTLTWDRIFTKLRMIDLSPENTKDEERRLVPIVPELWEHLRKIPRPIDGGHVFLYRKKPINDIRTGLKDACKKAGIKYGRRILGGFIFHDLRHTFNTNMRKAGIEESVIMQITGHSTREMFDRYNTIDAEDAKIAGSKLLRYLNKEGKKDGNASKLS